MCFYIMPHSHPHIYYLHSPSNLLFSLIFLFFDTNISLIFKLLIYMSCTGWRGLRSPNVITLAEVPSAGDKILILQADTVATLRKVVLVWLTSVLAECTCTLMVAEVRSLLLYAGVITRITLQPLQERCINRFN